MDRRLPDVALDALPSQVAVLDADGEIVYTNEAWRRFGRENGLDSPADSLGENYLRVCGSADDEEATEAAAGIRAVLDGDRDSFSLEYPCHSPTEQRWFTMRAIRFERDGEPRALVQHVNVTERRQAEVAVRERNDQLETVARVLSHDLRNPMGIALGHAELLADGEEQSGDHLDAVVSALERMDAIIDDALALARGTEVSDPAAVDLETAAEAAWSHVETDGATLAVDGAATLRADPDLLAQLFENCYRNAVEHAGPAVAVEVSALDDGFAVADDGPGIPPAEREAAFEAGHTTATDGTGFGLAIVERIATAHGWSVDAGESAAGGARIAVTGVETADGDEA